MRIEMLREHVTTIEKSIKLIGELSGKSGAQDLNQLIRWVNNKDQHADMMSEILVEYFLRQRIKAPAEGDAAALNKYHDQLAAIHALLVGSMKAKQTVDQELMGKLRSLIDEFEKLYFTPEDLEHAKSHH